MYLVLKFVVAKKRDATLCFYHTLRRLVPTHGYCDMSVGTGVWT